MGIKQRNAHLFYSEQPVPVFLPQRAYLVSLFSPSSSTTQFFTVFVALATAFVPVLAVPAAAPEPSVSAELVEREAAPEELEKRDNSIYVCINT